MADESIMAKIKKEKITFTDEEVDVLIGLWSKEMVLFNCKHQDYFKKDARNAATQRILQNLNKEGLSQEDLVKKMGSLRSYFGKEVDKERNSKTSGTGRKEVYTSKWPFFKSLQFLKDNITPRKTTSNMDDPIVIGDDQSSDHESAGTSNITDVSQIENSSLVDQSSVFKLNNPPTSKAKKRKSAELEEELLVTCLEELKKPRNATPVPTQDADTAFGNYVAKQIKKIPDAYSKEMMKIEIQQVIVRAMMNARQTNQSTALTTIDFNDLNTAISSDIA